MISTSKDLFQFAQVQKGHGVNITTEYQTAEVFGIVYSESSEKRNFLLELRLRNWNSILTGSNRHSFAVQFHHKVHPLVLLRSLFGLEHGNEQPIYV